MTETKISKELRNAKCDPKRKWLYTYTAWLLENPKDKAKIQRRLNVCFGQSKGYFAKYYRELDERTKNKNNKSAYNVDYIREARKVYRLYADKKLSQKSIRIIKREINGN